jgi:hypothetical protein
MLRYRAVGRVRFASAKREGWQERASPIAGQLRFQYEKSQNAGPVPLFSIERRYGNRREHAVVCLKADISEPW